MKRAFSERGNIAKKQRDEYAASGLVSVPSAAKLLGVSVTTTWRHINAGSLSHVRIGKRVLVPRKAALDFVSSLTTLGAVA